MATVGTVAVDLIANTASFHAPVKESVADMEQLHVVFESVGGSLETTIERFAEFAGVALSVGAALHEIEGAIDHVVQSSRLADRLGVDTQELEKFQFAAKMSGVEVDKFNSTLEILVRKIGQADDPTGKTAEKFEKLGLDMKQLANETPLEAFEQISAKIRALPTAAEKAAAAFDLFGKKGAGMLNLILQDSDALEKLKNQAVASGVALNEIEDQKLLAAHHAIMEMKEAVEGLWNELAVHLAPILSEVAHFLTVVIEAIKSGNNETLVWVARLAGFGAAFMAANAAITVFIGAMEALVAAYKALSSAEAIAEAFANPAQFAISAALATGAVAMIESQFEKLGKASDVAAKKSAEHAEQLKKVHAASAKIGESREDIKAVAHEMDEWAKKAQHLHEEVKTPFEHLTDKVNEIRELMQRGRITAEDYARGIAKAMDAFDKATASKQKFEETKSVGAHLQGTTAAFSEEQRIINEQNDRQKQQLEQEQQAAEHLAAIRSIMEGQPKDPITITQVKL